jgi:hypothetical protein
MKKTPHDKTDKILKQYKFVMQNEYDFIIRRKGASEGTVGSLDLYKYNVNFYTLPLKKF